MKTRTLMLLCLLLCAIGRAGAQDERLIMQFNFSNVEGSNVTDPISGITAKALGSATVSKLGQYSILDLGNSSGYFDMTAAAGALFKAQDSYTISVYYRVSEDASLTGNGFFLWSFSTSNAPTNVEGKYSAYRLNAQRYATSKGGYSNESAIQQGGESRKGKWIHVAYTESNGTGRLYIDGTLIGTNASMPKNSTNYGSDVINYCWLGRPPFNGDQYLANTSIADFRLYNDALSAAEVKDLAGITDKLESAITDGSGGDKTALLAAIAEAKALDTTDYPTGAVASLQSVITTCEGVAQGDRSQYVFDKYTAELKEAIATYKSKKGRIFNTSTINTKPYDTDRGFIHPGGLHTKEDFDRIRKQLADGNRTVKEGYDKLLDSWFAQSSTTIDPTEYIIRGGGVGENYITAARAASTAYQNGLRWQIEGNEACAKNAVDILMKWARTTIDIGGDSNYALAAGIYGYQFANAAELVRDYEGWSKEDFEEFKSWMLNLWYVRALGFLRGRNGTWENGGHYWEAPGHYWSNWGLCCALCVTSIGILCDDVFIYNQGMSFFKYDQQGTFTDPRVLVKEEWDGKQLETIWNDGLAEFLGNLVVTTSEWEGETGAYGKIGQMQESGRDIGHATMALGLAVELAHVGWNQGDDLFSYMDHRLAAGCEFIAAQQQGRTDLPWVPYHYANNGIAWWDGRSQMATDYAKGEQIRAYWGVIIGHYEGIKGVKMPFSEWAYEKMGVDGGTGGATSGGYDHLGFSVLMNYRPFATKKSIPTELTPLIEMDGKKYEQAELGGLRNHWSNSGTETLEKGKTLTLTVQLPDGEEDTGLWEWNTGATTRSITVTADKSYIYRATYTNSNGVKSYQSFAIAVTGDCNVAGLYKGITYDGATIADTTITVFYGDPVNLEARTHTGWDATLWDDGTATSVTTIPAVTGARTVQAKVTNQGGRDQLVNFYISPQYFQTNIIQNNTKWEKQTVLVANAGDEITLDPYVPITLGVCDYLWSDGSTGNKLLIENISTSASYDVTVSANNLSQTATYNIYLKDASTDDLPEEGDYMIRNSHTGKYMTCNGLGADVTFTEGDTLAPAINQIWHAANSTNKYSFKQTEENLALGTSGKAIAATLKSFYVEKALGTKRYAIHTGTGKSIKYWAVNANGTFNTDAGTEVTDYPFEFIPVKDPTGVYAPMQYEEVDGTSVLYNTAGQLVGKDYKGIVIDKNGKKYLQK